MIKKIIAFLLLFTIQKSFTQPVLTMHNSSVSPTNLQYLAAGDSIYNLQQPEACFAAGKFLYSKQPGINLGIASDNYWVTFSFSKPAGVENDYIVNLENPRLNDVAVYIRQAGEALVQYNFGDYFPFSTRQLYQNYFAIPIRFQKATEVRIFLFIKHKGNTLQIPISLLNNNSFYQQLEKNYLVTGITTGVLLLTFFFALFFFLQSKSLMFGMYAAYSFFLWAWLWNTEGYGFQYIYPNHPEWATRVGPGLSVLVLVFFIACCLEFCKPFDARSRLRKVLRWLMYGLALWGVLPFLPFIKSNTSGSMMLYLVVHFVLEIGCVILLIGYLLWIAATKSKLAWFYFTAVIVTLICSAVLVAKHSGWLNLPMSSGSFMGAGAILEMIIMTAGISLQFYKYKKEKEAILISFLAQQKAITQKILMTEEAERKRIARELHDDIGSGLTRITLMSDAASHKSQVTPREIEEIAATCRRLVDSMGEIVWSLSPENNSLTSLVAYMREELHKLLEYSGIAYQLHLPDDTVETLLSNEQRRNLLLVTKELVHNAVKYSKAENISVHGELVKNTISFVVKDDGSGFDEATIKKGNGLRNIRQRMEELGGKISFEAGMRNGTTASYYFQL